MLISVTRSEKSANESKCKKGTMANRINTVWRRILGVMCVPVSCRGSMRRMGLGIALDRERS
jgi:hypothetical protein